MRIFLTGCAGFIGAKTAELLLEQGHEVIGVDNLNDAYDPTLKRWRLSQLEGKPNFRFQQVDISEWEPTRQVFEAHMPYDAVVNLAARAGVRQSVQNPWVYVATNTTGALNLLELCRQHGIRKYVLASTSSLYANSERPFREDMPTDRPLSPYAASKKGAETMCYTYHHLYGLDITVLRYFTVYGPAGRPDMSIFRFIRWIAEGEPIQVFGDGLQERDFTYVDDIARGTIAALKTTGLRNHQSRRRPTRVAEVDHRDHRATGGQAAPCGRRSRCTPPMCRRPGRTSPKRARCWAGSRK
jgi:UDP-glucuronate 4-epimerase